MADLREEVLLGEPEMREAGILRRRHVVEVLRVDHSLRVLGPWLRHLELAHQSELHVVSILPVVREGRDAMGRSPCAPHILSPGRSPMPVTPRRKSLVGRKAENYSQCRAAFDFSRAPPHEDVDA